ncbi:MAG: hypothetical protein R3339_09520, partial [Thermodesulfobacteriota bacterium]|nr:hypothetical protein [Thermodesulfobacteriota bacterium]
MKWFGLFLLMIGAILCFTGIDNARSQEQAEKPESEFTGQEGKSTIPFTITDPALLVQNTKTTKSGGKTAPLNEKAEQPRKEVNEGALDEKQEAEIEDLKSRFRKLVEEEMEKFGALEEAVPEEGQQKKSVGEKQTLVTQETGTEETVPVSEKA